MNAEKSQIMFFFGLILAVFVLNFFLFFPYLSVLFLALIFSIIFDPLHHKVLAFSKQRETLAATLSAIAVFLFIVGPVSLLGFLLFNEATDLYGSIVQNGNLAGSVASQIHSIAVKINSFGPNIPVSNLESGIESYLRQGLAWLLSHMSSIFSGIAQILFQLFLMLLALFYFFRDGKKFIANLVILSPLKDSSDRQIFHKIAIAVTSVVRGNIVIGLVQGMFTGIGFAIFGVPSPILWGTIAGIASLAPTVGTSLILVPGVLFLWLSGHMVAALGLLAWGIFAVGLIDNVLGPILIQRGVHIHSFLIMLSVLGGLSLLGPVGFIAGPVALSLLFALLDLYPDLTKTKN